MPETFRQSKLIRVINNLKACQDFYKMFAEEEKDILTEEMKQFLKGRETAYGRAITEIKREFNISI